jgi:single-strand DNA-binding protein
MSFHTIIIVGNLGKDPEMRYAPNGNAVTSFSVASNRQYTDSSGQKVKETTWFRVSVWGKQAESTNTYLQKGSSVLIEGELRSDKETGSPRTFTRSDGSTGASYEITARTVRFLTPKGSATDGIADASGGNAEEDIPF